MSNVTRRGPVKPTMNITPLIDVVFLLIVFFMIVNNIVTDEVPELQLPDLIDPETHQPEGESRVIVNIIPETPYEPSEASGRKVGPGNPELRVLTRSGAVKAVSIGKAEFQMNDKEQLKAFQQLCTDTIARRTKKGQPPLIMLRADAGVYYSSVLPIMNMMQMSMAEALDPELAANTPIHLVAYLEN